MEVIEGGSLEGSLGYAGVHALIADQSTPAPSIHTRALPPSHTTLPRADPSRRKLIRCVGAKSGASQGISGPVL